MPTDVPASTLAPLDADGRVAIDAPCVNCGYNLRTLDAGGSCPECAHPVQLSIRGNFLCFAPPRWVGRLARGGMLVLIALCAAIGGVVAWIASSVRVATTGPSTYSSASSGFSVLFIGAAVWTLATAGLAIAGLLMMTPREPGAKGSREGISARRVVRIGLCALPLGVALALLARVLGGVWAGPYIATSPLAVSLSVVEGACWIVCLAVLPLALLRHVLTLMKRIPRPGLVLFARIMFWAALITTVLTLVSDAVVMATGLQVMRGVGAAAVAPGPGPVTTNLSSPGYTAAPPPATALPATAPTTMPVPRKPTFGPGHAVASTLSSLGACGTFGLAIAAFVLLILVQRALAQAARLAEQNAAIASAAVPTTTSPPRQNNAARIGSD